MTIEERYALSCYEELSTLHTEKEVYLVKNIEDDNLYVKKLVNIYNKSIYMRLMERNIPNVPKIYQCIEDEDKLVVIEEYIHGSSLQKIFQKKGILSEKEIIHMMISLCDILQSLHECNPPIVHRDIKPSNIMISNDGIVKLIDFNAAKLYVPGHSQDTFLIGTQEFAAPEQYGFGQSDQRTDIYAVGVTMNYLLTGSFPKQKLEPGILGEVIKLCTALDADGRYHNVGELKAALKRVAAELNKENTGIENEQQEKACVTKMVKGENVFPEKSLFTAENNRRAEELSAVTVEAEEEKKGEENIFTKKWYLRKKWLPVGFRTGVVWKMVAAFYGYLFIFWASFSTEVTSKEAVQTGFLLWANRIAMLIIYLGTVYFIGNYGNVRYQLPLMKRNKLLHWVLAILYLFGFMCMIVFLLVIIESFA